MKEIVLGLGHQGSIWSITHIADEQLRSIHGSPKVLILRSRNLTIKATRPQYEGRFNSFVIRVHGLGNESTKEEFNEIASTLSLHCEVFQNDDLIEVRITANENDSDDDLQAACDALSAPLDLPEIWRVHGEQYRTKPVSPEAMFKALVKFKSSDLHLFSGSAPAFRIDGVLRRTDRFEPLSSEQIFQLIKEMATDKHYQDFIDHQQCSFIYHQVGMGYARVSAFMKAGTPHCTMRFLPESIPSFEDLCIPRSAMERLANLHFGLILVTGMTGSGKSTTVASLVDWINHNRSLHILSIEQPVEFVHKGKKSVISQRDVGEDVDSFASAVHSALRHDPDVVVIGEMRDPDTIRSAISAAATGHLVISTLHSGTTYETVNRIISFFDPVERDLLKLQLRDALKCVICQRLLPKRGGGRQVALEFLFNDTNIISKAVMAGNSMAIKVGMQQTSSASFIFEKYLHDLCKQEIISTETAREFASEPSMLDQMLIGSYSIPSPEGLVEHHHR